MYFSPYGIFRGIFSRVIPGLVWSMPGTDTVYLTFDDGPCEHTTPWVLDTLRKYGATATFFCIGKNAEQHPELVERILAEGHTIGNHTYSHTKSLLRSCEQYVEDVDLASDYLRGTNLFRPPYGRLSVAKARRLRSRYHIVMWDIVSRDYSRYVSGERCVREVVPYLRAGSVVAFHDSLKAARNMRYALPRVLEHIAGMGLKCRCIEL